MLNNEMPDDESQNCDIIKIENIFVDNDASSKNINNYQTEVQTETTNLSLESDRSGKASILETLLRDPSATLTSIAEKNEECKLSGSTFSKINNKQNESQIHANKRGGDVSCEIIRIDNKTTYKCKFCNKYFASKGNFSHHVTIHTGEKPFKCNICRMRFRQKWVLRNHIITHTGEKPFRCDMCGKEFSQRATLSQHLKIHTGDKLYGCTVCDKRFIRKRALDSHMMTHMDKWRYKCLFCGKWFAQQQGLQYHIRAHMNELPYQCEVCERHFARKARLKRHLQTHIDDTLLDDRATS